MNNYWNIKPFADGDDRKQDIIDKYIDEYYDEAGDDSDDDEYDLDYGEDNNVNIATWNLVEKIDKTLYKYVPINDEKNYHVLNRLVELLNDMGLNLEYIYYYIFRAECLHILDLVLESDLFPRPIPNDVSLLTSTQRGNTKYICDVIRKLYPKYLNINEITNIYGIPCMHDITYHIDEACLRYFISIGLDINLADDKHGSLIKALCYSISYHGDNIATNGKIELLSEYNPSNLFERTHDGEFPVCYGSTITIITRMFDQFSTLSNYFDAHILANIKRHYIKFHAKV